MKLPPDVEEVLRRHRRQVSWQRGDAQRDAYARVRYARRSTDIHLPNHTQTFLKAIKYDVPQDGRVIFRNIPIFANPGDGKTFSAITIVLHLLKHYGSDQVAVYVSDHIPSLVDALRRQAKPVIVLLIDDALKNYSSRGGGNQELLDAISIFTTLRHEFESAHNTLNGIVFTIFTSQMYKGLDKVFREGFPIFKSALTSDKDEILSATHMGKPAWYYLEEILRDVHIQHDQSRMNDSVGVLPGYPAGRITLRPHEDALLDRILAQIGAERRLRDLLRRANQERMARGEPLLRQASVPMKYKAIELAWTIERTRLTPEQELARLNRAMSRYAMQFARQHEEDVSTSDGKAALREWLEQRVYDLGMPEAQRIPSMDYLRIREPRHWRAFCEKVQRARQKLAMTTIADDGYELQDGRLTDNDLLDYVANHLLSQGYDPYDQATKHVYLSLLYKLPSEIRNQAIKLRTPILSRIKELWLSTNGLPQPRKRGADPDVALEVEALARAVLDADSEQFELNPEALCVELIEQARVRDQAKLYRDLMVFRACTWLSEYAGRTLDTPTKMADTAEGQEWQRETFGVVVKRPPLQKSKTAGQSYFYNHVGLLFEAWVTQKLRSGYTVPGLFDQKPIKEVHAGGGNEHGPDLTVEYEDGTRDYVSLKCYSSTESINITTSPRRGTDEIRPERLALERDEKEGREDNRLVVLLRNLAFDGFLAARIFHRTRDIPETLGFNQADVGTYAFKEHVAASD